MCWCITELERSELRRQVQRRQQITVREASIDKKQHRSTWKDRSWNPAEASHILREGRFHILSGAEGHSVKSNILGADCAILSNKVHITEEKLIKIIWQWQCLVLDGTLIRIVAIVVFLYDFLIEESQQRIYCVTYLSSLRHSTENCSDRMPYSNTNGYTSAEVQLVCRNNKTWVLQWREDEVKRSSYGFASFRCSATLE